MPAAERHLLSQHYGGYKPSLPDIRDLVADLSGLPIALEVDPRGDMPDPYDQLQLGSCTGNAVAGAVEYDAILNGTHFGTPSRLFIYYGERVYEHTVNEDAGAYGRDGFKVCQKIGVPPETDWVYDISKFAQKAPQKAYDDAAKHKISAYKAVAPTQHAIQRVLSNKQTVAVGISVYESFESLTVEKSGVVPMPGPREQLLGGHELLIMGYLQKRPEYALVRNSWGKGWGLGGYCLMPWSYLIDRNLSGDWRTIPRPAPKESLITRIVDGVEQALEG